MRVDVIDAMRRWPSQDESLMMNIIASCLLAAVTVQRPEPVKSVPLMTADAPKAYRLGAGDGLGRAVFDNYKSVARANEREGKREVQSNSSFGIRVGDRVVVRIDCVDGERRVVYEKAPTHRRDPAAGVRRSTI